MSKKDFLQLSKEERAELAKQVKPLRLDQDMSQAELAELAGVTRNTIINIENGGEPQAKKLLNVLNVLGFETDVAFEPETEMALTIMGAIIENIPKTRRQKHVDRAQKALVAGLKEPKKRGNVIPLRPNVSGNREDEARSLGAVASDMEGGPEDEDA
jgi:transcriptional regulator with XRE-family HTH domain